MSHYAPIFTVAAVFIAWSLLGKDLQRDIRLYFFALLIVGLVISTTYSLITTGHIPDTATFSEYP